MNSLRIDIANPAVMFALVWSVTLAMLDAHWMPHLTPLRLHTVVLVGANMVSFVAIYTAFSLVPGALARPAHPVRLARGVARLRVVVVFLLLFWAAGSSLEIFAAGGVPVLWLIQGGTTLDYRDFGLASFHGLMNALYIFSLSVLYLDYLLNRKRFALMSISALLAWPVVIMSRGLLSWALVQLVGVFLLIRRAGLKAVVMLLPAVLVFIMAFGLFGDFRLGRWRGEAPAGPPTRATGGLAHLPSGFSWVYGYVTSSLNNVNASIDDLAPTYSVYYSTVNLFPTVVRRVVYEPESRKYPLPLVDESYNTFTVYGNFVADFGVMGAAVVMAVLQLLIVLVYLAARREALWATVVYPVLFQGIVLSVVTDVFTSLVNVAQVGVAVIAALLVTSRLGLLQFPREAEA